MEAKTMTLNNQNNTNASSSIATQSRRLFLAQERANLNRQQSMLNRATQRVGLQRSACKSRFCL